MKYRKIADFEREKKELVERIKRGDYEWLDDLTLLLDEPEPFND